MAKKDNLGLALLGTAAAVGLVFAVLVGISLGGIGDDLNPFEPF